MLLLGCVCVVVGLSGGMWLWGWWSASCAG